MSFSLYDQSVTSYLQTLGGVATVLTKGAQFAAENGIGLDDIVRYKLRDDMAPFSFQVISVWHHSLGAIEGLKKGEFQPPPKMSDMSYQDLQGLVQEATVRLKGESREDIDALADGPLIFKVGGSETPFIARYFIQSFSLPNFYFHATTTYVVLREHGVPLGKMDYLGQLRVNI